jgi:hypothetical protein
MLYIVILEVCLHILNIVNCNIWLCVMLMNILLVLLWVFPTSILNDPLYYGHVGWNMWEENQMQLRLTTSVPFFGYFIILVCIYKA